MVDEHTGIRVIFLVTSVVNASRRNFTLWHEQAEQLQSHKVATTPLFKKKCQVQERMQMNDWATISGKVGLASRGFPLFRLPFFLLSWNT